MPPNEDTEVTQYSIFEVLFQLYSLSFESIAVKDTGGRIHHPISIGRYVESTRVFAFKQMGKHWSLIKPFLLCKKSMCARV